MAKKSMRPVVKSWVDDYAHDVSDTARKALSDLVDDIAHAMLESAKDEAREMANEIVAGVHPNAALTEFNHQMEEVYNQLVDGAQDAGPKKRKKR